MKVRVMSRYMEFFFFFSPQSLSFYLLCVFLIQFVKVKHKGRSRESSRSSLTESKVKQNFRGKLTEGLPPLTETGEVNPEGTLDTGMTSKGSFTGRKEF